MLSKLKVILIIVILIIFLAGVSYFVLTRKQKFIQDGLIYSIDIDSLRPTIDESGIQGPTEYVGSSKPIYTIGSPNPFIGMTNGGIYGYLSTLNNKPGDKLTILMWIKQTSRDNGSPDTYLLTLGRTKDNIEGEFILRIDKDNKLNFWDYNLGYGFPLSGPSTGVIKQGEWVLVGVVKNGTTATYYINGVQSGTTTSPSSKSYVDKNLFIGGDIRDSIITKQGKWFIGDMGQVAIYNRNLLAQEMTDNFNTTKTNYGI